MQTGIYTLRQIKVATKNFDTANKVGEGGFGSVYKVNLCPTHLNFYRLSGIFLKLPLEVEKKLMFAGFFLIVIWCRREDHVI